MLGHGGAHGGLELLAVAAPGGPELEDHGRLAEVGAEVDGLAVEGLEGAAGGGFADGDAEVLGEGGGGGEGEGGEGGAEGAEHVSFEL